MKIFAARRLCVLLFAVAAFASHSSNAQDCGEPVVSLGEVIAGLQAGLTAGVQNLNALPSGYNVAASFEERRGFIIPEAFLPSTPPSIQCDNDYLLISDWFACVLNDPNGPVPNRTPKEARDCVNIGLDGFLVEFSYEVDYIPVDHMQTATKMGFLPSSYGKVRAAFFTAGHIIEPFSLSLGDHTATLVAEVDLDCLPRPIGQCDGTPDETWSWTAEFTIISSAQ